MNLPIPADAALTDQLRPLADALVQARIVAEEAKLQAEHRNTPARDKGAQAADHTDLRELLAAGKKPAKLPTKHADQLVTARRLANAIHRNAEQAELEAGHAFKTAADAATNELI